MIFSFFKVKTFAGKERTYRVDFIIENANILIEIKDNPKKGLYGHKKNNNSVGLYNAKFIKNDDNYKKQF